MEADIPYGGWYCAAGAASGASHVMQDMHQAKA